MALSVIACYDIREDSRRARMAALLQAWGDRIQKSVFVLTIDQNDLQTVIDRAGTIIDADHDRFMVTPCCAQCWAATTRLGQMTTPTKILFWAVM